MLTTLLMLGGALAADRSCEGQFDADDFRGWVDEAERALEDDDVVGHGAVYVRIQENLPCMAAPVPTDAWAKFLVGLAVVENALGQRWEEPMTSALLADADVAHDYGSPEVQAFAPILVLDSEEALPSDATYFIDGQPAQLVRKLPGVHIVQREYVGVWEARLVRAGEFPVGWRVDRALVEAPSEPVSRGSNWATVGLLAGFGQDGQAVSEVSLALPESAFAGPALGLASMGEAVIGGPGVFWDLAVPLRFGGSSGVAPELFGGARLGLGPVALWAGGGVVGVDVQEGEGRRGVLLPQPHLGLRVALPIAASTVFDAGVAGGWTPSATHESLVVGIRSAKGPGLRVGLELAASQAAFLDPADPNQLVTVSRVRAGLRAGLSLGPK